MKHDDKYERAYKGIEKSDPKLYAKCVADAYAYDDVREYNRETDRQCGAIIFYVFVFPMILIVVLTLLVLAFYTGKLLIHDMPATIKITAQEMRIEPDPSQVAQGGY
jgi:hypothetical protein